MVTTETVHATCVVIGDAGVLIRGPSGSGKSTLARRLLELAAQRGLTYALVGDDRVILTKKLGEIIAEGHPAIRGMIEVRGLGIGTTKVVPHAVIRLLADCNSVLGSRFPDADERVGSVLGISLRRITVTPDSADLVLVALGLSPVKVFE